MYSRSASLQPVYTHMYDQQPFKLDGKMVQDVSFEKIVMHIPIYVKMDAKNQLLLSEGI